MLQTKSVGKPLWNILRDLQSRDIFSQYFLVDGTALSLQLGHRISSVKLLNDVLSAEKIKQKLMNEMNNYNKNIIGNN